MSDFLIDHAVKNAWCTPKQDLQVIYQPQRITSPRGVQDHITYMWSSISLPTSTDVYHVYQIGQYAPQLIGLNPVRNVWRSLSSLMSQEFLFADLYTLNGLHFTRNNAYILVTENKDVLLAVMEQKRIADLRTTPVFLRLYSNAFFESPRSDDYPYEIICRSERVTSAQQALNFQREFHDMRARSVGYTWLYVNGYYRADYTPADYVSGDYVEYVHDSTVKAVKEFAVSNLDTFDSILDNKRKYLLHYSGEQADGVGIDYRDDIDVYLIKPAPNARWKGIFYHKNSNDAFRQVTHRDYSIAVDYVIAHQQAMLSQGWNSVDELKVQIFIRRSGYRRPLIFEHHRIQELYKLNETDRYRAMIGIDSTVRWWRAEELENSEYVQIMDAKKRTITTDLVRDAYGYNAIAKLIGDTPNRVVLNAGRRTVFLPYGTQVNSTAFEIDSNGKLIASYIHTSGVEYSPFNSNCSMVEMIVGRGSLKLDMTFNTQNTPIDLKFSYRFYIAPISHGVLQNDQWTDVTGDHSKYDIINGLVHWYVDFQYFAVCVKSDAFFLNYETDVLLDNGVLKCSVNATTVWSGNQVNGILHIPPGRLDVWLNNECLIEGLDYFVKWPQIVFTNKQYLTSESLQKIRIRCTGFCNADMEREVPKEVGFVRWGKLSRNNRFDLRDDRVIRLTVGGRTYLRSDVRFTEDDSSLWMDNVPNGSPYTLEDLVVPLRKVVPDDTYDLRVVSMEVDQAVSDYLSLKNPETVPQNPDPIPERYMIYSPFAASIMYDLLSGRLSTDGFKGQYSDLDVRNYLQGYVWLLDYEPTRMDLDTSHVAIHPHERTTVVELNAYQYFLLNRAIKVFLEDKVDITRFVRIKDSFI